MSSSPSGFPSNVQFGRQAGLYLISQTNALDLSGLRIKFKTTAQDSESLNKAYIRVYNPTQQTVAEAISEYGYVALNAGYPSQPVGTIFKGSITKFVRGKERNTDNFLDIYASDGDFIYNFGTMGQNAGGVTVPAGSTPAQRLNAIAQSMGLQIDGAAADQLNQAAQGFGGILPRGKTMFGLARSYMRDLANYGMRWSIQDGVLTVVANDDVLPGQAIVLNSQTGLIGFPESTQQGINVTALINPNFRVGGQVQINQKDITQTTIKNQYLNSLNDGVAANLLATIDTSNDGTYRIIVVEHEGDTRDNNWFSDLVCLSINANPQPGAPAVFPYGPNG